MEGVCRLVGRVAPARGRLLVEAQDRGFALRQGAVATAGWLRNRLSLAPGEARRQVALARDVHEVCQATGAALAGGELTVEQLTVRLRHHHSIMMPTGTEDPAAAEDPLSAGRSAAGPTRAAAPHDPQPQIGPGPAHPPTHPSAGSGRCGTCVTSGAGVEQGPSVLMSRPASSRSGSFPPRASSSNRDGCTPGPFTAAPRGRFPTRPPVVVDCPGRPCRRSSRPGR
ncbi:DUF222 domain-containing protein [Frankia sp. QA3]|uniref:DUF222 domain-containing protein n=1 Tax=Frankia sp. QA3 TaxID=710111 RepID=UPI001E517759|nr:DUF222 domain-containing protein [Frankia sp. QA3]